MAPHILVVEDEVALATLLDYNLKKEGYGVVLASHGEAALLSVRERLPDLIILDWMLPGISGIEICRRLRRDKSANQIPILMLTARGEELDQIHSLDSGADDYLVKPVSLPKLFARVRALLRRMDKPQTYDVIRRGGVELDSRAFRVRRNDQAIHLSPMEFRLLDFLMRRPGHVFSRQQLLDAVWGMDIHVEDRTVDVHIGRLRKALKVVGRKDPIRTVRAAGYSFEAVD